MANVPQDLVVKHNETYLYLHHDYMNIATSDQNWVDAAIALCKAMKKWQEDPTEAVWIDGVWEGAIEEEIVHIGRVQLDYRNIEIYFNQDTRYGYDGGQEWSFNQLKEQFDKIKKLPVFW